MSNMLRQDYSALRWNPGNLLLHVRDQRTGRGVGKAITEVQ